MKMLLKMQRVLYPLLFLIFISTTAFSQAPTTSEVMFNRIADAKAQLAVRNFSAAVYELENIARETNDRTIHRAINVLLMHSYLEQGDYKKSRDFLTKLFNKGNPGTENDYVSVAAQVAGGAKIQSRRYQTLGLAVSGSKLPSYAVQDLEGMRATLELVIEQAKKLDKNGKLSTNSLALLEETSAARGELARDGFDARRWRNEKTDAQQQIASSGSRILDATTDATGDDTDASPNFGTPPAKTEQETRAETARKTAQSNPDSSKDFSESKTDEEPSSKAAKENQKPLSGSLQPTDRRIRVIGSAAKTPAEKKRIDPELSNAKTQRNPSAKRDSNRGGEIDGSPIAVGSLIGYATKRVNPVYPRQARSMRMEGIVRVQLIIDENGKVAKIENVEGPSLLKRAARDAVRKWKFTPFMQGGHPTKATGFVSFNFNL